MAGHLHRPMAGTVFRSAKIASHSLPGDRGADRAQANSADSQRPHWMRLRPPLALNLMQYFIASERKRANIWILVKLPSDKGAERAEEKGKRKIVTYFVCSAAIRLVD